MLTKKKKALIVRWIKLWRGRLLLQHWTIHVEFAEEQVVGDLTCRASIEISPSYLSGRVVIYPTFWTDPVSEQERTILHELFHIIIDPLYSLAFRGKTSTRVHDKKALVESEKLTETFTNLLWDSYNT